MDFPVVARYCLVASSKEAAVTIEALNPATAAADTTFNLSLA